MDAFHEIMPGDNRCVKCNNNNNNTQDKQSQPLHVDKIFNIYYTTPHNPADVVINAVYMFFFS